MRELGPGDEAVVKAACRAFGHEGAVDPSGILERPEAVVIVAEDDDGIAGWVYGHELVHPDGERTMLLYALDVVERLRRRGIGSALTARFVERGRAAGCSETWVLTEQDNDAALATYARAGGRLEAEPSVMVVWDLQPDDDHLPTNGS
jgi:ribosomal protein S18 acetylase RimI-like enzyme